MGSLPYFRTGDFSFLKDMEESSFYSRPMQGEERGTSCSMEHSLGRLAGSLCKEKKHKLAPWSTALEGPLETFMFVQVSFKTERFGSVSLDQIGFLL